MKSRLVLRLLRLVAAASALSSVKAFSTDTIGDTKATRIRANVHGFARTKNAFPIVTGESSSSMAAWPLSFGSPCKLPKVGEDGMYHIANEAEYRSLLEANPDKLIVLKVYSEWCKTCKAMAPRFEALARGIEANHRGGPPLPIIWATMPYRKDNNHFIRRTLGVKAVPSVQLYAGNGVMVESFPCGPAKVTKILLPKLVDLIASQVDVSTGTLKPVVPNATTTHKAVTNIQKLHP